jgi:F-type H+-transporting ATPase subunit epsilon
MATLHLEITTAERVVYSGDVQLVLAPGAEGQLGILPDHASLMTTLEPGEMVLRVDGEDTYMAVTGGFLEVTANQVTVLADACERAEEIDESRAQEAQRRAAERLRMRTADVDLERAVAALNRAELRLRLVRRRRRGAPAPNAEV